ncbi:MerR family transcriptional regulator [Lacticaseibacillus kribbianus]|uniref:MerR family transcriptional regulator n=1 Tax=Lacticaseibacillus kribbianus TaxID=2926292 RepID=UPI001CD333E7
MNLLKIGAMAKLNHISIQTLRLYDQEGLFSPAERDADTGYRYYTLAQCPQLDMIQFLRGLSFSLAEIRTLMTAPDANRALATALDAKQAKLDALTVRIQEQRRILNDYRASEAYQIKGHLDATPHLEQRPERRLLTHAIRGNIYQMDATTYELALREMKGYLAENGVDAFYYQRVGSVLDGRYFTGDAPLVADTMFVMAAGHRGLPTKVMPAGPYLTTYCDRFEDEIAAIGRLRRAVQGGHYRVCGDYLCEVLTEAPNLAGDSRHMFLRLQLPVRVG